MNYYFNINFEDIERDGYKPTGITGLVVSTFPINDFPKWIQKHSERAIKQNNPNLKNIERFAVFYKADEKRIPSPPTSHITKTDSSDSFENQYMYIIQPLKKI